MSAVEIVRSVNYRVTTRAEFIAATDRPAGLMERAEGVWQSYTHVLWDPDDNDEGFMLWGDDPEALAQELVDFHEFGEPA